MNGNTCLTSTLAAEKGRIDIIAGQLDQYLGPEYVSYRKGEGGRMLAYAEGHEIISMMNTDRKSTRLNSSHDQISYAVFCLKKKKNTEIRKPATSLNVHADQRCALQKA